MILKHFLPGRDFSMEDTEGLTGKRPGMATWPQQTLLSMRQLGFDVAMAEAFDVQAFIDEGGEYLRRAFGDQLADWQIANSDIPYEQGLYQQLQTSDVTLENRVPEFGDMKAYLDAGHLITCTVNSRKLNKKPGYAGHAVLVYDLDDQHVTFHDPGLPPLAGRRLTLNDFEAAWAYPNEQAKGFIAMKYKGVER